MRTDRRSNRAARSAHGIRNRAFRIQVHAENLDQSSNDNGMVNERICVIVPKAMYSRGERGRLDVAIKYDETLCKERGEDRH